MSAELELERREPRTWWRVAEDLVSVAALMLMVLLPVIEMVTRTLHLRGVPASPVLVQQLTLWVGLLGAALASRSGRLLALSSSTFLPERIRPWVSVFTGFILAAVSACLAYASQTFVQSEREAGSALLPGLPKWWFILVMPVGFGVIAARAVWLAGRWKARALAALGLFVPVALGYWIPPGQPTVFWIAVVVMFAVALLGLPIFAVFGGFALLLFWNASTPVALVPVEMYRLVASPLLPSIPLFTLAGYFMVQGGATKRLLRVFTALFSWMPGGLALVTVLICAMFTWAGSGLTILSIGGLLVPVLVRTRYPEKFSIGLVTSSGSLGLLFPTSVPTILYCVYSQTPIDQLFIGGLLPLLLMVSLVAAMGIYKGLKCDAVRDRFSPREAAGALWEAKWELLIPAVMVVGIFGGFGTLTEAAALTAFIALIVEAFVYRDLKLVRDYDQVFVECATIVGGVLLIMGVALGFTNYLVNAEIPARIIDWVQANVHSKLLFLFVLNIALLVVGALMDVFAAILVVVPLLKPLGALYGIHPVQMGIIFIANLELGYLHPPVGINLFLAAYRFKKPMTYLMWATLPFLGILFGSVLLITYLPWLTEAPLRWFGK
ncbi:MAG: TRAP transporter large permease subunit [Acidobacteria bacterium]|nr:TRAP transporter large permease subunit [Acidobacteriota bacterium]